MAGRPKDGGIAGPPPDQRLHAGAFTRRYCSTNPSAMPGCRRQHVARVPAMGAGAARDPGRGEAFLAGRRVPERLAELHADMEGRADYARADVEIGEAFGVVEPRRAEPRAQLGRDRALGQADTGPAPGGALDHQVDWPGSRSTARNGTRRTSSPPPPARRRGAKGRRRSGGPGAACGHYIRRVPACVSGGRWSGRRWNAGAGEPMFNLELFSQAAQGGCRFA